MSLFTHHTDALRRRLRDAVHRWNAYHARASARARRVPIDLPVDASAKMDLPHTNAPRAYADADTDVYGDAI